jgi:hypothetical protein
MAGRETLVKTVLTAQPIYHLTVFPMQKWLLRQIDKMRSFLWKGEEPEKVSGGALSGKLANDLCTKNFWRTWHS